MRNSTILILCILVFVGCRKYVNRHDMKFRNQFVGNYQIDSIVYHLPKIDSASGSVTDTNYCIRSLTNDFFQILPTQDQIEKNVTNTGKFLDSVFTYEIQGFKDDKTGFLCITSCDLCPPSSVMRHFIGTQHIVSHSDKKLVMESRFIMNDKTYFGRIHLRKN